MESLTPEEENIIKNIRNLFVLKKKQNYIALKYITNLFRLKKEIKGIKDIVLRSIKSLFENEKAEGDYYKSVRVSNCWSNNYIEYKSNDDRNKTLSVKEYLDKIRPYLQDIINDLINNHKQSDTFKNRLTITVSLISSKYDNDEEHVIHSKSYKIEIMISDGTMYKI